jgi:hypothetical protein
MRIDVNTTTTQLPKELEQFIQGKVGVLKEELVIDGKTMTVLEIVQGYRSALMLARILGALALVSALGFAGTAYWFSAQPVVNLIMGAPY